MNKVSLYIPCYNVNRYIKHCLDAVLKQTYPIDEILIIDDSPNDEIKTIVSGYPVAVISRHKKLGIASARNAAIAYAKNEFVASLDADSVPNPNWLQILMDAFTQEDIAGAGGRAIEKNTDSLVDKWRSVHMRQHWGDKRIVNPRFLFGNNSVFRKNAMAKAGFFNEEVHQRSYEDVDMSYRLKERGFKIIYEPKAVVYHIQEDNLYTLLRRHWNWVFLGVGGKRPPNSLYNVFCKTFDSFFGCLDLVKGDIKEKRFFLLGIDILSFFHHLFYDFKHYIRLKCKGCRLYRS